METATKGVGVGMGVGDVDVEPPHAVRKVKLVAVTRKLRVRPIRSNFRENFIYHAPVNPPHISAHEDTRIHRREKLTNVNERMRGHTDPGSDRTSLNCNEHPGRNFSHGNRNFDKWTTGFINQCR
jgi:hypothetical protein